VTPPRFAVVKLGPDEIIFAETWWLAMVAEVGDRSFEDVVAGVPVRFVCLLCGAEERVTMGAGPGEFAGRVTDGRPGFREVEERWPRFSAAHRHGEPLRDLPRPVEESRS